MCPQCGAFLGAGRADDGVPDSAAPTPTSDERAQLLDALQQVVSLLAQNKKLEAIKVYRTATGASLADAKAAVEAIGAQRGLNVSAVVGGTRTGAPVGDAPALDEAFEAELLDLVRQSQWIAAIKRYRDRTGLPLRESKAAIDALAQRHGLRPSSTGCGGVIAVVVVVAIAAAIVAAAMLLGLAS